jgi:hypothetical protein
MLRPLRLDTLESDGWPAGDKTYKRRGGSVCRKLPADEIEENS